MSIPATMNALLLKNDGYARQPSGTVLEALDPYVEAGTIAVPEPEGRQVLIKVDLASINPSDVMFVKGMYGQPRVQGRPAGFEGVGHVVAAGPEPEAQAVRVMVRASTVIQFRIMISIGIQDRSIAVAPVSRV